MELRFALEDTRDYLAAEVLASQIGVRRPMVDVLPSDLVATEKALILAASLIPVTDPIVGHLLSYDADALGWQHRLWLAACCVDAGQGTEPSLRQRLCQAIAAQLRSKWARNALHTLGEQALLSERLYDKDEAVRVEAARVLARLGETEEPTLEALLAVARNSKLNMSLRSHAVVLLAQASTVVPGMPELLVAVAIEQHLDRAACVAATRAICRWHQLPTRIVKLLLDIAHFGTAPGSWLRLRIAAVLIGPQQAVLAVDTLIVALRDRRLNESLRLRR